jgi:cob(I)alamin adenosyltransferase
VDELNSYIGLVSDHQTDASVVALLRAIQDRLFTIGAALACDPGKETKMKIPDLKEEDITVLEKTIDEMNGILPPLRSFLLPGGGVAVSTCHIARCVCRRAERLCVSLADQPSGAELLIIRYLNRLSDYLFMLARYTAHQKGIPEILWEPRGQ